MVRKKKSKKNAGGQPSKTYDVGGAGGGHVSLTGAVPTIEDCLAKESTTDKVGRMFCEHNKDYCHVCCVDYRMGNRYIEEGAGLKKKETELEEAARMYATALKALRGMEKMHPRPSPEVFAQNRQWRDEFKAKIVAFERAGESTQAVVQKAFDRELSDELDMEAMMQNMAKLNPGQTEFEMGGEESQKIYDEFVKAPEGKGNRADHYTCSYCGETGTVKLLQCSRCKKATYCSKKCQVEAWPSHKKNECDKAKPNSKEPKKERLTWDQVEAHSGEPASGKLEVKVIKDESVMRQVFQCKDRVGMCRRIAAYTDSREIAGLKLGATLTWKNPRFHHFMDGSSGARIEEEDLNNITVS